MTQILNTTLNLVGLSPSGAADRCCRLKFSWICTVALCIALGWVAVSCKAKFETEDQARVVSDALRSISATPTPEPSPQVATPRTFTSNGVMTLLVPAGLVYSSNPVSYTLGTAIVANLPTSSGGAIAAYSVSPDLPTGINLDTTNGVISGTPTAVTPSQIYTITASNASGSITAVLAIAVNPRSPSKLVYTSSSSIYLKGLLVTPNVPTNDGGAITSYAVSRALPTGLNLDETTGVISGIPTDVVPNGNYTITGRNSTSSTTTNLNIAVNLAAPSNLIYTSHPAIYTKGIVIPQNSPTSSGGTPASYSVSPSLPAGLILSTTSGVISGTPTAAAANASYTIMATNAAGSTTAILTIAVNPAAPNNLSYLSNSATYTAGTTIIANQPTSSGGAITAYAVSPALPAGLSLSTITGVISGTPTVVTASTSYTITATNVTGSTTASVSITVILVAPSSLVYSVSSPTYVKDVTITPDSPTSSGGAVASYAVSPALPAGLSLNTSTGVISGTPTAVTANASYTVTATNVSGSTTASVAITVNPAAPSSLSYSSNPVTYTQGTTIIDNLPTSGGGAVASYAVSPALPAGLSLNTTTGAISGTPTTVTTIRSYTITGTNVTGSTTASVSITVILAAPSSLVYSSNPATYVKDSTITANSPTSGGGAVVSYAVSPALPAGLNLNTTTGVISGIPTAITANASYIITATNTTGSTTASVAITVNPTAPSGLVYSPNPAVYTKDIAITESSPLSSGGAVASYAVSPALPTGLTLNTTTGIITGTPTVAAAAASYTITATNVTGSTTATLSIRTYLGARFAYATNQVSNSISMYTVDQVTGKLRANGVAAAGSSPRSIAVDPTGRFAFVANSGANTVSVFSISTAGKLTLVEHKATGTSPYLTTVDPSGRFVYVVNDSSNNTSAYSINQTTGALTELSGSPFTVGTTPRAVAVSPSGRFGYVVNLNSGTVQAYTINESTGALVASGTALAAGSAPQAVAVDPSGRFAYVAFLRASGIVQAYTINQSTGVLQALGTALAAGNVPISVTVDPTGRFAYVPNFSSNNVSVYTIQASGDLVAGTTLSTGTTPGSVTVDPSGRYAYITIYGGDNVGVYDINQTTGALTANSNIISGVNPVSLAFSSGVTAPSYIPKFAYTSNLTSNDVSGFTINATSGVLTSIGSRVSVGAGTGPLWTAINPLGTFAYVANHYAANVSAYAINQTTGDLTGGTTYTTGTNPREFNIEPSGRFAYAATQGGTIWSYSVNQTTGALTQIGTALSTAGWPNSISFDSSGRFAYAVDYGNPTSKVWVFSINQTTGILTQIGTTSWTGNSAYSITLDPSGRFAYVPTTDSNFVAFFTISQSGLLTKGADVAAGTGPMRVNFHPSGKFAYIVNKTADTISCYTLNQTTGLLTALTTGATISSQGTTPRMISVDPSGKFLYVSHQTNTVALFTIDQTTGQLTFVQSAATGGADTFSVITTGIIQ